MGQDLVDIQDLMLLLGYTDPRSVKKWCKQRDIPILSLGLKKYVSQHILTQYIDNQFVKFVKDGKVNEIKSKKSNEVTEFRYEKSYQPKDKIISKYLAKYESDAIIKAPNKK